MIILLSYAVMYKSSLIMFVDTCPMSFVAKFFVFVVNVKGKMSTLATLCKIDTSKQSRPFSNVVSKQQENRYAKGNNRKEQNQVWMKS